MSLLVLRGHDITAFQQSIMKKHMFPTAPEVLVAVDRFWSGVWLLALRRWWQERKLADALEETGEQSIITRRVTERYRVLERSMCFWRASPPLVLNALEAGHRAGIPLDDLQMLALNRDLRVEGNTVKVRRNWWIKLLAPLAVAVVVLNWARLSTLVVLASAPWWAKLTALLVITVLFWWFWRGFALYTTRANTAIKRSGAAMEAVALSLGREPAKVHAADFQRK